MTAPQMTARQRRTAEREKEASQLCEGTPPCSAAALAAMELLMVKQLKAEEDTTTLSFCAECNAAKTAKDWRELPGSLFSTDPFMRMCGPRCMVRALKNAETFAIMEEGMKIRQDPTKKLLPKKKAQIALLKQPLAFEEVVKKVVKQDKPKPRKGGSAGKTCKFGDRCTKKDTCTFVH